MKNNKNTYFLITVLCIVACGLFACSHDTAPAALTKAETQLNTAQSSQASKASAAVIAAGQANDANPPGLPKTATTGELSVASANLPAPAPDDAKEALARVNAALTGQLASAQQQWTQAVANGNALKLQVNSLTQQVSDERKAAADETRLAAIRIWSERIMTGGIICIGLAIVCGALASSMGLTVLTPFTKYFAAAGIVALGAAYLAGTPEFAMLAFGIVVVVTIGLLVWAFKSALPQAKAQGTAASGFTSLVTVIHNVEKDVETDTTKLWDWIGNTLSKAEKEAAKLISPVFKFADSPSTSTTVAPAAIPVTPLANNLAASNQSPP